MLIIQKSQAAGVERHDIRNFGNSGQENQDEGERQENLEEGVNSQEFHDDRGSHEKMQDKNVDNLTNQLATDSKIEPPLTQLQSPN